MPSSCVVVGGGLAGMLVARDLARLGWTVTLLEKSDQLGGKAEAVHHTPGWVEHGYHVFPAWYDNVRALLDELGIELVDFDRYYYARKGEFPSMVTVRGPSGVGAILHNTFRGLLPWYHTLIFGYSVIDMLSRPLSQKRLLDRISHVGLMRSGWYMTESVAELNQENVLKASAIPAYEMSAMTAKKIAAFWVKRANPFLSVLEADLQTAFIAPFADSVAAAGVDIKYGAEVTGLALSDGNVVAAKTAAANYTADVFVVTTPLEVTRNFVADDLYERAPSLGNIHHLEADPMSALHLYLNTRIEGLPREHVFLHGGRYGISLIDVSQTWEGHPNTVLSCISSHFVPLKKLSNDAAAEHLIDEITEYLPIDRSMIEHKVLNTNVDVPLFINTVAAWPNRPRPITAVPNLYMAGDWVKNDIDLACMEGAVSSALEVVRAIRRREGHDDARGAVVPATYPRALFVGLRWAMLPVVFPTWLIAKGMELLTGE